MQAGNEVRLGRSVLRQMLDPGGCPRRRNRRAAMKPYPLPGQTRPGLRVREPCRSGSRADFDADRYDPASAPRSVKAEDQGRRPADHGAKLINANISMLQRSMVDIAPFRQQKQMAKTWYVRYPKATSCRLRPQCPVVGKLYAGQRPAALTTASSARCRTSSFMPGRKRVSDFTSDTFFSNPMRAQHSQGPEGPREQSGSAER